MDGSFKLLSFADGPDVAYLEGLGRGELVGTVETVTRLGISYDRACADALSPEASRDLIASLLEDPNRWGMRYVT